MVRKMVENRKRRSKSWMRGYISKEMHTDIVLVEKWWFLFIPIYSRQTILGSDLRH